MGALAGSGCGGFLLVVAMNVEEKKAAVVKAAIRYVECDDVHAKTFWLLLESAYRALVESEKESGT